MLFRIIYTKIRFLNVCSSSNEAVSVFPKLDFETHLVQTDFK